MVMKKLDLTNKQKQKPGHDDYISGFFKGAQA
jgi:hypothetical protein